MKKVGRTVYGSGDTIVKKTSHFFQDLTLGAEGGGGGGGLVRGTLRYTEFEMAPFSTSVVICGKCNVKGHACMVSYLLHE